MVLSFHIIFPFQHSDFMWLLMTNLEEPFMCTIFCFHHIQHIRFQMSWMIGVLSMPTFPWDIYTLPHHFLKEITCSHLEFFKEKTPLYYNLLGSKKYIFVKTSTFSYKKKLKKLKAANSKKKDMYFRGLALWLYW